MFRMLWRKLKFWQLLQQVGLERASQPSSGNHDLLSPDLESNLQRVQAVMGYTDDLIIHRFELKTEIPRKAAMLTLCGKLGSESADTDTILRPLLTNIESLYAGKYSPPDILTALQSQITGLEVKVIKRFGQVLDEIVAGNTVVLIDHTREGLSVTSLGWPHRDITEPETESVVRGPREGFVESVRLNVGLLRKRLRTPDLRVEQIFLGESDKTEVNIVYLQSIANPKLVEEVRRRLQSIKTDTIIESGFLEEFIEDAPFSIFSTIGNSERPDVIKAKLLEGRVAIFVDNTPMVLTVPYLFVESFQSPEDYYSRPYYSTAIRWLRYLCFFISALLPALYVALTTHHQEIIPTPLLLAMAAAREEVPFPVIVEALLMGVVFEILREAGVRMPRPVGQAVSIVGALVIGEAAVSARLIAPLMVIIVALTAIASFVIPPQTDSTVFLRLIFTLAAGLLGAYGLMLALLGLLVHLASLRSFGTPFLSPLAPTSRGDLKDVLVRAPLWAMRYRPRLIGWREPQRQGSGQMPTPPEHEGGGAS